MSDVQTFGKFGFDFTNLIIELNAAYTSATVQEIYDAAKDAESFLLNMDDDQICSAAGKDDLGGGLQVGITMRLLNGWRLKAADRGGPDPVRVAFTGGNIVTSAAQGPDPNDPLAPADYVTYSLSNAVSAALLNVDDLTTLRKATLNRWRIDTVTQQLIYYDDDGTTPIRTFDLKDSAGLPSATRPYERTPV